MEKTEQLNDESVLHDDHLETFSLLWMRGEINKNEINQNNEHKLRAIINYLKIFEKIDQCQQYIQSMPKEDRSILIVNDKFSRELVENIHNFCQVSSIYVYCSNEKKHKQWSKNFSKIRAITNQFDDILIQIELDQKIRMKIEEPLSIKPLNVNDDINISTTKLDESCIYFQIFIDILLRIRSNEEDINEFFYLCKKEYKGNKNHLATLREFEHNYSSNTAIQWFIHRPFLQKILNKAFQLENIDIIYLFRPFIRDICYQLRYNQYPSSIKLYKGQLISKNKLNYLKKFTGKLISINSFLLASTNQELVINDLEETTPSNPIQK
ncbi:unnamed protein product, partial [Rotaria sp. Silwood2]